MHDCAEYGVGGRAVAIFYFVTFVVLGQFMMMNLFIAVILEISEEEMFRNDEEGDHGAVRIMDDHFEHFREVWKATWNEAKQRRQRAKVAIRRHEEMQREKDQKKRGNVSNRPRHTRSMTEAFTDGASVSRARRARDKAISQEAIVVMLARMSSVTFVSTPQNLPLGILN